MQEESKKKVFLPAKVFRRTGEKSFSVQLMTAPGGKYLPGVVEVHCTKVDWGNHPMLAVDQLSGDSRGQCEDKTRSGGWQLWERLQTMGTAEMFITPGTSSATSEPGIVKGRGHMGVSEGVEICLGQYEPRRHAFMRCELRVSASQSNCSDGIDCFSNK